MTWFGGVTAIWTWAATSSSDRKSTRLNSSHSQISYAVFCLKKNNTIHQGGLPSPEVEAHCGRVRAGFSGRVARLHPHPRAGEAVARDLSAATEPLCGECPCL